MGHKVNPNCIRFGIIKSWNSIWYSDNKNFSYNIKNDYEIRKYILNNIFKAFISKIIIERPHNKSINVIIYSAKPGVIIGKKGEDINKLKISLIKITNVPVKINILEIKKPELDAKLISDNISYQLSKRIPFRRIIKKISHNAMKSGAKGIKIKISGRLGGSEIARKEWCKEGRIPLHTFRADIDYGQSIVNTNYGVIGIKVWVFKGEIF